MRKPKFHRAIIILKDEPNDGECYITKKSLTNSIQAVPGLRWVSVEVESIERAKECTRCGELIGIDDSLSGKYCGGCFQEVQEEQEEARTMRKQK